MSSSPRTRPQPPTAPILVFGVFELDPAGPALRRRGAPVKIRPQPLMVLSLLANRRGRVVTRDEIRSHLWGDDMHVDYDVGINGCIKAIRAALDDRARAPRFVETVPRRGYRFLAPVAARSRDASTGAVGQTSTVDVVPGGARRTHDRALDRAPADTRSVPATPLSSRRRVTTIAIACAVVGLVVAGVVAGLLARGASDHHAIVPRDDTGVSRLVVLPFIEYGVSTSEAYLGDALAAELSFALSRRFSRRLTVIAWTSAMQFKDSPGGIDELAAALEVDYVVEGTVRRRADQVRVTTQLVRVTDRAAMWANEFESDVADTLALQTEFGDTIALALALELLPGERRAPVAALSREAREAYLKGRFLIDRFDPEAAARAIGQFERAIELAPRWAAAHAGLAHAYLRTRGPGKTRYPLARAAADAALALDPDDPDAHLALAHTRLLYDWDLEGSGRAYERTLELDPGYADAYNGSASYYSAIGQHDRALRLASRALELDPMSPENHADIGWYAYFARDYSRALAHSRDALELQPDYVWAHRCVIMASLARGDTATAIDHARDLMRVLGADATALATLDRGGQAQAIRAYWRWAQARFLAMRRSVPPVAIAFTHLGLGDREAALDALEASFAARTGRRMLFLAVDPAMDPLRDDPRFLELVSRIGNLRG